MTIGFIGQGFIGKNYADDFERRGFSTVRYAKEEPYVQHKDAIAACDIVFIAVPTPTTLEKFDHSILQSVLPLVGVGNIAVIKSTTLPGTIQKLQDEFPDRFVLHSPEFLREKTAAEDAAHPERNIIGIPKDTHEYRAHAQTVLSVLPKAPYERIVSSNESELVKYAGNIFLYMKTVYANVLYDLAAYVGADYTVVQDMVGNDARIGPSHLRVLDTSGHPGATAGRGAGGHCFIKDFAAFRGMYETLLPHDVSGINLLRAFELKNNTLLNMTNKDLDLLQEVYGSEILKQ